MDTMGTLWNLYLAYLKNWQKQHQHLKYFGDSPATFNEWLWNDEPKEGGRI